MVPALGVRDYRAALSDTFDTGYGYRFRVVTPGCHSVPTTCSGKQRHGDRKAGVKVVSRTLLATVSIADSCVRETEELEGAVVEVTRYDLDADGKRGTRNGNEVHRELFK